MLDYLVCYYLLFPRSWRADLQVAIHQKQSYRNYSIRFLSYRHFVDYIIQQTENVPRLAGFSKLQFCLIQRHRATLAERLLSNAAGSRVYTPDLRIPLRSERSPRVYFVPFRISAKKLLPLSSTMMTAGKSTTSILRTASMPSSSMSTISTFLMFFSASRAAGPPTEPR